MKHSMRLDFDFLASGILSSIYHTSISSLSDRELRLLGSASKSRVGLEL